MQRTKAPFRADEVGTSFTQEEALSQAPEPIEGHFGVPRIIEVT